MLKCLLPFPAVGIKLTNISSQSGGLTRLSTRSVDVSVFLSVFEFFSFTLFVLLLSAITLDNTLVILSTVAPDAGRYYVQAVNDKNGDNKTSQPITLSVESE